MDTTSTKPRITWWVWAWNGERSEKMRHTAAMRGTWGWDASCSCGWETSTGGAIKRCVADEVYFHKLFDHAD
jgi:hypothetical protein